MTSDMMSDMTSPPRNDVAVLG